MLFRAVFLISLGFLIQGISRAEEGSAAAPFIAAPAARLADIKYRDVSPGDSFSRAWKLSLLPLVGSQALDAASSYGMRELNPALANANGRFGMKSASIKIGAIGALVVVEYLVIRRHPGAANAFAKLNWATGIVTTGFAAHNFAIR